MSRHTPCAPPTRHPSEGPGLYCTGENAQCKTAKVNKEWRLLGNELREKACKEASSAVHWWGGGEVVEEGVKRGAPSARRDASRRRPGMTCTCRQAERCFFPKAASASTVNTSVKINKKEEKKRHV